MRVFLISIFFAVLFSFEVFGQNGWTMVNNGPNLNSFVQNETVLSPPLKVERTFNTTASEYALSGDYLIVGILGTPNTVKAFSWSSGAELWSFEIPGSGGGIDCAPAISDNLVLCGGQHGEGLYALNISDGSVALENFGVDYGKNFIIADHSIIISNSEGLDILTTTATDVDDESINTQPNSFKLADSYPNPFSKSSEGNSSTTIKFSIPNVVGDAKFASPTANVTLKVYNIFGKEVATLVNEKLSAGEYEVKFNAVGLPAGVYFYQLRSGSFLQTKKMILLK